jgi:DNA invertase Pin-like site-specific DNA recombinase
LSRKGIASTIRIVQHLIDNNVELISKSESIDTGSELGLLFISIISAFSKIENNLRNDKIKAGLAAAKARRNGQNWQRGKQRDESKDISIRILKEQGLSNRSIATQLGISRGKVERCLQSFKEGVA